MRSSISKKLSLCGFFCIVAAFGVVYIVTASDGSGFISSDGLEYYRYLTEFIEEHNFHYSNKYPIGTALCELPFFLAGCFLSRVFGLDMSNGLAPQFHLLVGLSGMFYCGLGSVFAYKTAERLYGQEPAGLSVLFVSLGTFLYVYAAELSSFSHIYSYAFISIFVYMVICQKTDTFIENLAFGAVFGIIFLIRNENIVVGFLYLLGFEKNRQSALHHYKRVFACRTFIPQAIACFLVLLPQFLIWHASSGHYLTYSYGNESFLYLKNPKILEVLFSDAKGLFIFSPVLLFSVFGLVVLRATPAKNYLIALLAVILAKLYLLSSWWGWWLGCGLGTRSFIDILPIFIFLAATFFSWLFERTRSLAVTTRYAVRGFFLLFATLCCIVNLLFYAGQKRGRVSNNLSNHYELRKALRL